jgi:large subunit ribosomal protein L13
VSTYVAKASTITPSWYLIDAKDLVVGRLATRISTLLRGKHLPTFTSHVNPQVKIVVINAEKIRFTGNKMDIRKGKVYYHHTG